MFKKIYSITLSFFTLISWANAQWIKVTCPRPEDSYPVTMSVPNANTVWASYSFLDSKTLETAGSPTIITSGDGGATWVKKNVFSALQFLLVSNVAGIDKDTAYLAAYDGLDSKGGGIYKTTDMGNNWKKLLPGQLFNNESFPNFVYFWNAAEGIAMGDATDDASGLGAYLEVYTTTDYGQTWTRVPRTNIPYISVPPIGIVNRFAVSGNTIWAQVFDGLPEEGALQYIYRSKDKGLTWEAFRLATFTENATDIVFVDELNGVVNDYNGLVDPLQRLYRTSDGGETWTEVAYSGTYTGASIAHVPGTGTLVSSNSFLSVGPKGTSYSTDLGNTWTAIDEDPNLTLLHTEVGFFDATHGWTGQYLPGLALPGGMYKWDETNQLLPITLSYFSAAKTANSALLKWGTASEFNFSHFVIERSANGKDFKEIGRILGTGSSSTAATYSYEDLQYEKGMNYYRLKIVNKDGSFNYSKAENIDFAAIPGVKVFPIPARDKIFIEGVSSTSATVYTIVDINGKVVRTVTASGSNYAINIANLATGTYYLQIQNGSFKTTQKFIKQ